MGEDLQNLLSVLGNRDVSPLQTPQCSLLLLQFCFPQFLSPLQMAEVADGRGRVSPSRAAVASHHSCYDPTRLSFLCQCLFGLFGLRFLNTLFIGKTRRKGGLASWQMRLSLREREERISAITSLLTFNTGLEIMWLCAEVVSNKSEQGKV